MSIRKYDFIIYGATGFTGKEVVKYALKHCPSHIKFAIAGRSQTKMNEFITSINAEIDCLVADVQDKSQLAQIFSSTCILLNCVGPYRFLGKAVVEACLEVGTHYLDICGEPQFLEDMFLQFQDIAVNKKVNIIHSCAFDSVPADLGCLFTQRLFEENCCESIESFLSIDCPKGLVGHYTTFECAVHGISDSANLKQIRKNIDSKYNPPKMNHVGDKLKKKEGFFFEDRISKYSFPFMGADSAVVRFSHRSLSLRKGLTTFPQYGAYATVNNWLWMTVTAVVGGVFFMLASFDFGKNLLLNFPEFFTLGVFSHEGPNQEQLDNTFFTMEFFAQGYSSKQLINDNNKPDKKVKVMISGPEPGYVATPAIFIALTLLLIENINSEKFPKGGVMTPSSAFYDLPEVFDKLKNAGLKIEFMDSHMNLANNNV